MMIYTYRWLLLLAMILCHTVPAGADNIPIDLSAYYTSTSKAADSSGAMTIYRDDISALAFHDNGGTVGVSAFSYNDGMIHEANNTPIPEPATMTLLACGLFFASWRMKRMKRLNKKY